jgi:hypothetical protein
MITLCLRWYGSIVRTSDDKFVMIGGWDIVDEEESIVSEILEKDSTGQYNWRILEKTKSERLFGGDGRTYVDSELRWYYPRSFLDSDGNIFGISYNLMWVMDKDNDYKISEVGAIPLVESDVEKILKHENANDKNDKMELRIETISSPVGNKNTAMMVGKDKILVIGGAQINGNYSSSNRVYEIDFKDVYKPKLKRLKNMIQTKELLPLPKFYSHYLYP